MPTFTDKSDTYASTGINETIAMLAGNDTLTVTAWSGSTADGGADWDSFQVADSVTGSITLGESTIANFEEIYGGLNASNIMNFRNQVGLTFVGGNQADAISVGSYNSVSGMAGNDSFTLYGTGNHVYGGDGDDTFTTQSTGSGNTMHGGAGNDIYYVRSGDVVVELAGEGYDTVRTNVAHTMAENVEALEAFGGAGSAYTGNAGDNAMTITGSASGMTLNGMGGNDTLKGNIAANVTDYLNGGDGDDTLHGYGGSDLLNGGAGNDAVRGYDGDDLLNGGEGDDTLIGDVGDDIMHGNAGNDLLWGGEGLDTVYGDDGDDEIVADAGDDYIDGGSGRDLLNFDGETVAISVDLTKAAAQATGKGNDTITGIEDLRGGTNADYFNGNFLANHLQGMDGNDTLYGNGGNDWLEGGAGMDVMGGGSGVDRLDGGEGDDFLSGEAGNDTLIGGAGTNTLDGGLGLDTADYSAAKVGLTLSLSTTGAQKNGDATDYLTAIENLIGSAYADSLTGSAASNRISGGAGDDQIYTGEGKDTLSGGAGNDLLDGGTGNDTASYETATGGVTVDLALGGDQDTGGAGTDLLVDIENLIGSAFDDALYGTAGANVLTGGLGDDTLDGRGGRDTASYAGIKSSVRVNLAQTGAQDTHGGGIDTLISIENVTGGLKNDYLVGSASANTILGGAGNDTLFGAKGDDIMNGNEGSDIVRGGEGMDVVGGGLGSDRFLFATVGEFASKSAAGADRIVDFSNGDGDLIDISQIDADTTVAGNQAFTFIDTAAFSGHAGELRYESDGADLYVSGDINGDGAADFMLRVDAIGELFATDFIL